ncbi:pentapeptide repeat-containing protein [Rhizohabitans arisaemae]|uniref:pentapeptide repeat-containing protein n=1 Tax=Rhizohabitans arisaemae TaxID=2720610 RepID=UPI0024B0836C|nr:pentapeptide repeat-containing protein [Rhizohabitans arisaemae]
MHVPEDLAELPYARKLRPHEGAPEAEEHHDAVHFADAEFEDCEAEHARFGECAFTGVDFTGGRLSRARFDEVWMRGTRWVGTYLGETEWLDVTAISGVFAGLQVFGSELRRVVFRRCKFDAVNLRSARLTEVVFEDCVLRDVDWGGATLTNVRFPGSTLERVRLSKSTLTKVDLSEAAEVGVADGYDGLRGATIGEAQLMWMAPMFAQALGVKVAGR